MIRQKPSTSSRTGASDAVPRRRSMQLAQAACNAVGSPADREGSTLVVVIALLGALLLLGILALTLSSQEGINSEYFADSAKVPSGDVGPEIYFDYALRQIILGPEPNHAGTQNQFSEHQSALFGGKTSLMANMFGRDLRPYNGPGVNAVWDGTQTDLDMVINVGGAQGSDRIPDRTPASSYLDINVSPAATGSLPDLRSDPPPDVAYSYPDINSPFLSYDGLAPTSSGATLRTLLPSFHRPQYLRGFASGAGNDSNQWYTNSATARRVLRPHVYHRAVAPSNGRIAGPPIAGTPVNARFVSDTFPDDDTAAPDYPLGKFPFPAPSVPVPQGPWSGHVDAMYNADYSGLDADTDNDGIPDSIYIDLGFPAESIGGGKWRVPIFAISIRDADGLFNLNAHGNVYGARGTSAFSQVPFGGSHPSGGTAFISRSNRGASSHEVNPQWGLHAFPASGSPASQIPHQNFFGQTSLDTSNAIQLANMEWWFLCSGIPVYASPSNITDLVLGKFSGLSERSILLNAAGMSAVMKSYDNFPRAGVTGTDDNFNRREGASNFFPLDLEGQGMWVQASTQGRERARHLILNQYRFQAFYNYSIDTGTQPYPLPPIPPPDPGNLYHYGLSVVGSPHFNSLLPSFSSRQHIDEPEEMKLEPAALLGDHSDSPFGPEEAAITQLSDLDLTQLGLTGRVDKLAPVNFAQANIRKLYSPLSWDLKSFGKTYYGPNATGSQRGWEFNNNASLAATLGLPGLIAFPPSTNLSGGSQQPFRDALGALLLSIPVPLDGVVNTAFAGHPQYTRDPMARFSVNHLVEFDPASGRIRFRALTPHPASLGNLPVNSNSSMASQLSNRWYPEYIGGDAYNQEWLARRDRQLMCRDIYTILYMLCGGNDATNYASSSNATKAVYSYDVPTRDQCKMMAQFAVNLVDQLDGDDIITQFEYDIDLSNGWGVDDNAYANSSADPQQNDRRVVYGIEEQQLVFSEANSIWATMIKNIAGVGEDNDATEWKDDKTKNWLHFELQNVSARRVDFTREAWQVAVVPKLPGSRSATVPGTINGEERRLTFRTGSVAASTDSVTARPVLSVITDSEADQDMSGNVRPSTFVLNPHKDLTGVDMSIMYQIAPRALSSSGGVEGTQKDLIKDPAGGFYVNTVDSNGKDAAQPDSMVYNPVVTDLVHVFNFTAASIPEAVEDNLIDAQFNIALELRRRLNPWRDAPNRDASMVPNSGQADDNPWIVVDTIEVPINVFKLRSSSDDHDEIRMALTPLGSYERRELLQNKNNEFIVPTVTDPDNYLYYVKDSIGQRNYCGGTSPGSGSQFHVLQNRNDRNYASVVELFDVPLYGPDELTDYLVNQYDNQNVHPMIAPPAPPNPDTRNMVAGMMFLNPVPPGSSNADEQNRWYRLLEFVEIPSRWHLHYTNKPLTIDAGLHNANPIGVFRTPGRVNLNMIRNPEVLAGLMDDRDVFSLNPSGLPALLDSKEGGVRDWWTQFLWARDGADPLDTSRILPGLPPNLSAPSRQGGRPFRPVESTFNGSDSLEDTVYRKLPSDFAANPPRRLFEVGALNETYLRPTETAARPIEYEMKHRLLEKVVNNSTTRTNVYFVFIQVDFFEAGERTLPLPSGEKVFRVGAKRTTDPSYRGFYVLDRSKALELMTKQHLPRLGDTDANLRKYNYSFDPSFNYKSLILYNRTIE